MNTRMRRKIVSYDARVLITCPTFTSIHTGQILRLQKKAVTAVCRVQQCTYLRVLPEAAEAACASSKHYEGFGLASLWYVPHTLLKICVPAVVNHKRYRVNYLSYVAYVFHGEIKAIAFLSSSQPLTNFSAPLCRKYKNRLRINMKI